MTHWSGEDDDDGKGITTASDEEISSEVQGLPTADVSVEEAAEMAHAVESVIGARVEEAVKEPAECSVSPPDIVLNAPEPSDFVSSGSQQVAAPVHPTPKLRLEIQPSSPTAQAAARKSPVTVQEWVDSIPISLHRSEEEGGEDPPVEESDEHLDLGLGAEAGLLYDALPPVTVVSPAEPSPGGSTAKGIPMLSAHLAREPSVQSDVTSHTGSHCSSVESYLESRRPDPEEVLLSLGFGGPTCGAGGVDSEISRIPRRFLQPSKVKGVAIDDFLRYQQDLVETFESGFCGYRGLTGSSTDVLKFDQQYSSSAHIMSSLSSPIRTYSPFSPAMTNSLVNIPGRFLPQPLSGPRQLLAVPGKVRLPSSGISRSQSTKRYLTVKNSKLRRASEPAECEDRLAALSVIR